MDTFNPRPHRAISIVDLRERLADPNLILVDARPTAAYNGWPLNGEARGGHVPGAVAFPSAWLATVEDAEVQRLLHEKGVTHGRTIVVYGDGADDAAALGERLTSLGHDDVWVDEAGFSAWAADETLPLERLPNFEKLVHPAWVRRLIAGGRPDTYPGRGFAVLHVNFGVPEEYEEGHLPGALYLDTNRLENPDDWNRRSPDELHATLGALGISADTTVVLYGRDTIGHANEKWPGRRAGQIAATRAALILAYAGVRDVRVLDGGYDRWVLAGNPVETVIRTPVPVASFGVRDPAAAGVHRRHRRGEGRSWRPTMPPSSAFGPGASIPDGRAATTTSVRPAGSRATSGATAARTRTTCSITAASTTRCARTRRSPPTGRRPASRPTSGWRSTAAPAGAPPRPGSMPS